MKSVLALVAAALLCVASVAAQLTINTPSGAVVCQPLLISWTGGTPPYYLSILPGGQPTAAALFDFGTQTGNSLTWTVNVTAGTSLGLNLRDSTGTLAQSAPFTVQAGTSTACLTASSATSATSTGSGSSTGSTSHSTTVTTTSSTTSTTHTVTTPVPSTTPVASKPTTSAISTKSATSPSASAPSASASKAAAHSTVGGQAAGLAVGVGAALLALLA